MDSVFYQRFSRIKIREVKPDFMKFELRDTDSSIANALRRKMIVEVPTIAIDLVEIEVNPFVLNDEFISHRLGLIPLTSERAMSMRFSRDCDACDGDGQYEYCSVEFYLRGKVLKGAVRTRRMVRVKGLVLELDSCNLKYVLNLSRNLKQVLLRPFRSPNPNYKEKRVAASADVHNSIPDNGHSSEQVSHIPDDLSLAGLYKE
ncbi:hypothetical protein CQW23_01174 [Capsicum baccatum]|uniref:DNA-directed RNA polymerase RpoA/D/Rpb3-type domain-containing protein n=1 Tax=Capsicum baccatum TaxID=33114 RepID=A0A2G2XN83_CAPBA|nr:hypothetical protein CQW23_01174 [Capsicum baccatum]